MNNLKRFCWFLLGFFLAGFACFAKAETVPATEQITYDGYPSASQACNARAPIASQTPYGCGASMFVVYVAEIDTTYCRSNYGPSFPYGPPDSNCYNQPLTKNITLGCPSSQGWTLNGSTCTRPDCPSGQTRDGNGQCVQTPCPAGQTRGTANGECKTQCGAAGSSGSETGELYKTSSTAPGSICGSDGCSYQPKDCMGINGWSGCWVGKSTGSACNSNARNADGSDLQTPAQQAAQKTTAAQNACINQGKCPITINGAVTCGTCSQYTNNGGSTSTDNNGTTQVTKGTDCTLNGSYVTCTTTTTTTTTPTGGGAPTTTTGTSTETETLGGYCQKNPGAQICGNSKTECEKNPNLAQCKELGDAPENPDLLQSNMNLPEALTPVLVNSTAAICPADIPLPRGMSFEWDGICMFVEGLRPVILALAWISAAFIVLGVRTDA